MRLGVNIDLADKEFEKAVQEGLINIFPFLDFSGNELKIAGGEEISISLRDSKLAIPLYAPLDEFSQAIDKIYYLNYGKYLLKKSYENIETYGFYSRDGGSGTTAIALEWARQLGDNNRKSLYINLETYNSANKYLELGEDGRNLCAKLRKGEDFDFFSYLGMYGSAYYLKLGPRNAFSNIRDMNLILNYLEKKAFFEAIVFDMGKEANEDFLENVDYKIRVINDEFTEAVFEEEHQIRNFAQEGISMHEEDFVYNEKRGKIDLDTFGQFSKELGYLLEEIDGSRFNKHQGDIG
ncbi:MAG: hypothetical protein MJ145_00235 [Clostridia bacterium]|nr:hypothetical protein [Clostridia bacterium]